MPPVVKTEPSSSTPSTAPAGAASSSKPPPTQTYSKSRIIKSQRSDSPPPPTGYRDIPLLSTSSQAPWVHHLLRFAHHTRIDPTDEEQFVPPLKLNRKQPPKVKSAGPQPGDPVVDRYGKPVKLPSGQVLTWPRIGDDLTEHKKAIDKMKPQEKAASAQYDASLVAPSAASAKRANNKFAFQKRVRQIHKSSTTSRRLHNDESTPWVMEDFETPNYWESSRVGRKDNLYALAKHLEEGGTGLDDSSEGVKKEDGSVDSKALDHKIVQHAPWIGKLEGDDMALGSADVASGSSAHVLFVFDDRGQGGFKVIPVRKQYRFMQKSRFAKQMNDEEREQQFAKQQKSRDLAPEKFAARLGGGIGGVSSPRGGSSSGGFSGGSGLGLPGMGGSRSGGSGGVKKEEGWDDDSWPALRGLSLGSGPARPRGLVAVSGGSGRRRGGGDDEDGDFHRRGGDDGGTFDELDYQEDFADDEERMGGEAELVEDNEAREMEERLKREMAKAGVGGDEDGADGMVGDDDEEDAPQGNMWGETSRRNREDDQLTGSGRQMKKIMKALSRREGGAEEYDSDEDVNPYASEESDEEEVAMTNPEEAMRRDREEKERQAKEAAKSGNASASKTASAIGTPGTGKSNVPSGTNSRGATPVPSASNTASGRGNTTPRHNKKAPTAGRKSNGAQHHRVGSGHADLAKRATTNAASNAGGNGSGSSTQVSRSGSPAGSRSPSPGRDFTPRQSSPLADASTSSASLKRPASPQLSSTNTTTDSTSSTTSDPNKRLKTNSGDSSSNRGSRASSPMAPPSTLELELISLVRNGVVKNIAEVIARFKKRLTENPGMKAEMTTAFKRVLTGGTKGESLRVKDGF